MAPAMPCPGGTMLLAATLLALCAGREVQEKTPTPCKAKYDEDFINTAAEKYLEKVPANQPSPHMLLLLGGSGAGKGTFLKHLATNGFPVADYAMHGIDDYLEMLPEWKTSSADPENVYKDAADGCYGGAIPIAKAAQKKIIERKMHTIYEETGKNLQRVLERVVPPFKDAGYRITVALVDCTPEIATDRAEKRFQLEGRYSAPDYVKGTFKNVFQHYLAIKTKDFVADAVYCDNSCGSKDSKDMKPGSCMRCWDDNPKEDDAIPKAALLEGRVDYMTKSDPALEL